MSAVLVRRSLDAGLVTNDRQAALAFWSGLLGFPQLGEVTFPGMTIIRLGVGDSVLRILVPDDPAPQLASTGDLASETGLRYLTLQVANLDALVAAAQSGGYPVPHPPHEIRPGVRAAMIGDGAGVLIELQQVEVAA